MRIIDMSILIWKTIHRFIATQPFTHKNKVKVDFSGPCRPIGMGFSL